jgi:hypothetical protein
MKLHANAADQALGGVELFVAGPAVGDDGPGERADQLVELLADCTPTARATRHLDARPAT